MMMSLRPLALGEIVDRSATFWRAHWKPLFQVMLGFQLVQYALTKALDLVIRRTMRDLLHGQPFDLTAWFKNPVALDPQSAVTLGISTVSVIVGSLFIAQLTGVAATAYIFPRVVAVGPAPTVWASVEHALSRVFTAVGTVLLSFAVTAAVAVPAFTPALLLVVLGVWRQSPAFAVAGVIVAVAVSMVLMLWYVLRFILTGQVAAAESLGAWRTIRRTGALSSGRVGPGFTGWVKGRLTILVTVVFGVLFLVSTVSGLPAVALQVVYGTAFDPSRDGVPVGLLVPAELLQVAASALIDPLYLAFQVIFYVDMRVRREGLDLELALTRPELSA